MASITDGGSVAALHDDLQRSLENLTLDSAPTVADDVDCCRASQSVQDFSQRVAHTSESRVRVETQSYQNNVSVQLQQAEVTGSVRLPLHLKALRSAPSGDGESVSQTVVAKLEESVKEDIVRTLLSGSANGNKFGDVTITDSDNIHIGNVTYITGPVNINHVVTTVQQKTDIRQTFVNNVDPQPVGLRMVDRRTWLAQPPLAVQAMPAPADLVIICHTATQKGDTQAENTYTIRIAQTFHIESKLWDDIGYNFMVGCDGNVYEGRGWNVVGAHTQGFNVRSVGIAFVGCFLTELPPPRALAACKLLLAEGLRLGHLTPDYKLVGHCQCFGTQSPGRVLYEEITTWPHWTPQLRDPSDQTPSVTAE